MINEYGYDGIEADDASGEYIVPCSLPRLYRDLPRDAHAATCACGVTLRDHYDGWDGNRLSCEEAQRRNPDQAYADALRACTGAVSVTVVDGDSIVVSPKEGGDTCPK